MHNNAPNESPFGLSTVLIDKIFKMIKYTKQIQTHTARNRNNYETLGLSKIK